MNELLVYVWIASLITFAVNELKKLFEAFILLFTKKEVKVGVFASILLGFWTIMSYQTGLLYTIGIKYVNSYFKYADLTISALVISGGASIVYSWIESVRTSKEKIDIK